MENKPGIYLEWVAAKGSTWFTTRSPYPELPCYISPLALPTCSNFSSYLPNNASIQEVRHYLEVQVRILRFNNPKHTSFMVKTAITDRMLYWLGNRVLSRDAYYLTTLLDEILVVCFQREDPSKGIYMDKTKYWYSDEIVRMPGKGRTTSDRFKAKLAARQSVFTEGYVDDMRVASMEYRVSNFDVKPTVKVLKEETGYCNPTIKKYGREFYVLAGENIEQRVIRARRFFPEYVQQEIADLLGEKKRTVRQYWRGE